MSSLRKRRASRASLGGGAATALLVTAGPALAHHAMGRELPATFVQGLLSGLGHPVIGPDHFACIVAVGLVAAVLGGRLWLPVAFVLASIAGALIHLAQAGIPFVEVLVSLSVIVGGLWLATAGPAASRAFPALLAAAGLFHGYAYAESIIGAERTPLGAYFLGFTLVQLAIAASVMVLARRLVGGDAGLAPWRRAAGVGIALVGTGTLTLTLIAPA